MSLLVVGMSHRSAPVSLLERATIPAGELPAALATLMAGPALSEAMALSTCNRVELYAEVDRFHPGVNELSELLAKRSGTDVAGLGGHLYVHYEDAAVAHLFTVAAGLDSMVVGEAQILGQLRTAYAAAGAAGTAGRRMHEVIQRALRVGKRVHSQTGIDAAGASLVTVGLAEAGRRFGELGGRSALVCGAGSMAALAVATLRRAGVVDVTVTNRTPERAERLASTVGGCTVGFDMLEDALSTVDIMVSTTGAVGVVISADTIERAMKVREGRPLFVLDLALPRDVDPRADDIEGVTLVDLEALGGVLTCAEVGAEVGAGVEAARALVAEDVAGFLAEQRSVEVAPTVTALRSRAATLVDTELARLSGRLPGLDATVRAEVESTVRRVVAALLHTPTVRVKELAGAPGGNTYARALRELFELDPSTPEVVARATVTVEGPAR